SPLCTSYRLPCPGAGGYSARSVVKEGWEIRGIRSHHRFGFCLLFGLASGSVAGQAGESFSRRWRVDGGRCFLNWWTLSVVESGTQAYRNYSSKRNMETVPSHLYIGWSERARGTSWRCVSTSRAQKARVQCTFSHDPGRLCPARLRPLSADGLFY